MKGEEFGVVLLTELIVVIMSDGRWYSATLIKKRLKVYKGVASGTLDRLRRMGYVRRAKNPRNAGRPYHRVFDAPYVYQWTGKPWVNVMRNAYWPRPGIQKRYKAWLQVKHLPKAWQRVLR